MEKMPNDMAGSENSTEAAGTAAGAAAQLIREPF
jgi:hypothetical protein